MSHDRWMSSQASQEERRWCCRLDSRAGIQEDAKIHLIRRVCRKNLLLAGFFLSNCYDIKILIQQATLQIKAPNCTSFCFVFGCNTTTHRDPPYQLYHFLMNINKLLICNYLFILYFHYTQECNTSALQCNLVNFDQIKCYFWIYIWLSSAWST